MRQDRSSTEAGAQNNDQQATAASHDNNSTEAQDGDRQGGRGWRGRGAGRGYSRQAGSANTGSAADGATGGTDGGRSSSGRGRAAGYYTRQSMDGRKLLEVHGDLDFGTVTLDSVHLSQRWKYDELTGYYFCAARLPLVH